MFQMRVWRSRQDIACQRGLFVCTFCSGEQKGTVRRTGTWEIQHVYAGTCSLLRTAVFRDAHIA